MPCYTRINQIKEVISVKTANIQTINNIGKAGHILSSILKVLSIIAIVGLVIAIIAMFCLPSDLFRIDLEGSAVVSVDISTLGLSGSEVNREELNSAFSGEDMGSIRLDGMDFSFSGSAVQLVGDTLVFSADAGAREVFSVDMIRIILIMALIAVIGTLVCTVFAASFCKSLSVCESPFCADVVKKMEALAWSMLALPVINSVTQSLAQSAGTGNVNITLNLDLTEVLILLAMFALVAIFKHGAQLQQEADETL